MVSDCECMLCGNKGLPIIRRYVLQRSIFRHLFVGQCQSCGLLQATPLPTAKELFSYYSKSYRGDNTVGQSERAVTVRQESQASNVDDVLRSRSVQPHTILDIGAGHGQLLNQFKSRYPDAKLYATEVDDVCCEHLSSRGVETQKALLEELEEPPFSCKFDLILCSHILEHCRKPAKFLRHISSMLSVNGTAMIEVPNCGLSYIWGSDTPHLAFFSEQTLRLALSNAGLNVISVMTGGISAWEYVLSPTPNLLTFQTMNAWYADSPLPESLLKAVRLIRGRGWNRQKKQMIAEHNTAEERLENKYRSAFFKGSLDGAFLRAIVAQ